jgi:hypothetical protein
VSQRGSLTVGGKPLVREQIQSFIDAAACPVVVTYHDNHRVTIEDADGGTARLLEMLCGGAPGTDGYTRAKCGEIEIAARRGTR